MCRSIHELGASFVACQFWPEANTKGTIDKFRRFAAICKDRAQVFANQEATNYTKDGDLLDEEGNDLLRSPDGCHRWDISGELLKAVSRIIACPKFMKEGWDPVWAAIALGAARQYGDGILASIRSMGNTKFRLRNLGISRTFSRGVPMFVAFRLLDGSHEGHRGERLHREIRDC